MSDPPRPQQEPDDARPTLGVAFEARSPLRSVLAWEGLPAPLRRALTRAVPPETLDGVTFGESVRARRDPVFREWVTALLAYDAGVTLGGGSEATDSMIGLLSAGTLETAPVSQFTLPAVRGGEGFGASFRASSPIEPASVCCAAFVYRDSKGALEADFVFLATPNGEIVQLELWWVEGRVFDERHVEHALGAVAGQVDAAHEGAARDVVREALRECIATLDRS